MTLISYIIWQIIESLTECAGYADLIPRGNPTEPKRRLKVSKTFFDEETGVLVKTDVERAETIQTMLLSLDRMSQTNELSEIFNLLFEFEKITHRGPCIKEGPLSLDSYNVLISYLSKASGARLKVIGQSNDSQFNRTSAFYTLDSIKSVSERIPVLTEEISNLLCDYIRELTETGLAIY